MQLLYVQSDIDGAGLAVVHVVAPRVAAPLATHSGQILLTNGHKSVRASIFCVRVKSADIELIDIYLIKHRDRKRDMTMRKLNFN